MQIRKILTTRYPRNTIIWVASQSGCVISGGLVLQMGLLKISHTSTWLFCHLLGSFWNIQNWLKQYCLRSLENLLPLSDVMSTSRCIAAKRTWKSKERKAIVKTYWGMSSQPLKSRSQTCCLQRARAWASHVFPGWCSKLSWRIVSTSH